MPPKRARPALFAEQASNFFFRTSCKIHLSKLKSATNLLSLEFSSSSCLSLHIFVSPIAPNFFFPRQKVCCDTPSLQQISAIVSPVDSCANTSVICSSENRFFFMLASNGFGGASVPNTHFNWTWIQGRDHPFAACAPEPRQSMKGRQTQSKNSRCQQENRSKLLQSGVASF